MTEKVQPVGGLSIPTFSPLSLSVEPMFLSCPNSQTRLRAPSGAAPALYVLLLKFSGTCRAGKFHGEALAFGRSSTLLL